MFLPFYKSTIAAQFLIGQDAYLSKIDYLVKWKREKAKEEYLSLWVPENNNQGIPPKEHFANKSVFVDWKSFYLPFPSLGHLGKIMMMRVKHVLEPKFNLNKKMEIFYATSFIMQNTVWDDAVF